MTKNDHISDTAQKEYGSFAAFSFFRAPVTNTRPACNFTLRDAFNYITSDIARQNTQTLRTFNSSDERKQFKANAFDYCTFSGVFAKRNAKSLSLHSTLICFDLDDLQDVDDAFRILIHDPYFNTLLLFRSPSGNGLKWVLSMRYHFENRSHYFQAETLISYHSFFFDAVSNYLLEAYGLQTDQKCSDIARACFLPYDPSAYINPQML